MKLNTMSPSGGGVGAELHSAIIQSLPGATVRVTPGSPGHFSISVTSEVFRGQTRVSCQRMVYKAIAHLMRGDGAPVHAVDQLETNTP